MNRPRPSSSSAARRRSTSPSRCGARRCQSSDPVPTSIDTAEDRRLFERFLQDLGIPQPPGAAILTRRGGDEDRRDDRLSGAGAAVVRARWPRDGDRSEPRRAGRLRRTGSRGRAGQAHPHRQVPRGPRSRGRCHLRRRVSAYSRHHGAHRAGGRAFRRLDGRLSPEKPRRWRTRGDRANTPSASCSGWARSASRTSSMSSCDHARRRASQRLRPRGEPARRAARCRSSRRSPACQWCSSPSARCWGRPLRDARLSLGALAGTRPRRHQGAGLLDVEADRRGHTTSAPK